RELKTRRVDHPRREDEVVGEGVRLAVATGAYNCFQCAASAGKAAFIAVARQREDRERVMLFAELEINARLKGVGDARRRDRLVVEPDSRSAVDHLGLAIFIASGGAQIGAVRLRQ